MVKLKTNTSKAGKAAAKRATKDKTASAPKGKGSVAEPEEVPGSGQTDMAKGEDTGISTSNDERDPTTGSVVGHKPSGTELERDEKAAEKRKVKMPAEGTTAELRAATAIESDEKVEFQKPVSGSQNKGAFQTRAMLPKHMQNMTERHAGVPKNAAELASARRGGKATDTISVKEFVAEYGNYVVYRGLKKLVEPGTKVYRVVDGDGDIIGGYDKPADGGGFTDMRDAIQCAEDLRDRWRNRT